MRRCVAVAADHRGAGERESLLWPNDMDNPLSLVAETKVCDTKVLDILLERYTLGSRVILLDEAGDVLQPFARSRRNVLKLRSGTARYMWAASGHTWSVVARVQSGL